MDKHRLVCRDKGGYRMTQSYISIIISREILYFIADTRARIFAIVPLNLTRAPKSQIAIGRESARLNRDRFQGEPADFSCSSARLFVLQLRENEK